MITRMFGFACSCACEAAAVVKRLPPTIKAAVAHLVMTFIGRFLYVFQAAIPSRGVPTGRAHSQDMFDTPVCVAVAPSAARQSVTFTPETETPLKLAGSIELLSSLNAVAST